MTGRQQSPGSMGSGILWMVGCLASFIGMAVASRELAANLSIFQILFFRSLVGVCVLALFARAVLPEVIRFASMRLHAVRNVVHFAAQYCWTVGVALLPLAEVIALEFTMPVWVAVFAFLILGERITWPRIVAIAVSLLGVLVILRPGSGIFDPAAFVVLAAAMGYGLSVVFVKQLTGTCSPSVIVVWMIVLQLPMGLVMALFDWRAVTLPDVPWIVIAGITGLSAHYTMAKALNLLDASIAIPIDFLRVPLIAMVGFYLYGETIDLWLLLGAVMIFTANYVVMRVESRKRRSVATGSRP